MSVPAPPTERGAPDRPPEGGAPTTIARRPDLVAIADWIKPGSNVLDLGCGDGALLAHLYEAKRCRGYGVEIDDAEVLACAKRGVDVVQQNIEEGLEMFRGGHFDVVVLSMAIQATHRTEKVLREMSEVAAEGIVSFPNFGHWFHIWSILMGRMPVTREMPYQWYDTPNLHLTTIKDFEDLLARLNLKIVGQVFLKEGRQVRALAGKRATQAIYRFRRA
jgi:methionine biosynthesis protein MetW